MNKNTQWKFILHIELRTTHETGCSNFFSTQINSLSDFQCLSDFCWFTPIGHWLCEPQVLGSNPQVTFVKSYWNKFLKVIFLPKNHFSFAFCTFISVIWYFIFHHQTSSSWLKKLYPGVMSHLKIWTFTIY